MGNEKLLKPTLANYQKRDAYNQMQSDGNHSDELVFEQLDFLNSIDWGGELFLDGELCGLKNALGEVMLAPVFENMKLLSQKDIKKDDWIVAMQNGKWGVVLADGIGTWLVQPEYDTIGYPNNLTYVCKDGKWGVIELSTQELIIPLECDKIFADNGFMFINGIGYYEKDGKTGVITTSGIFTGAIFDEADGDPDGFVKVKFNGEWGFINEDNKFTTDEDEAYYYSDTM